MIEGLRCFQTRQTFLVLESYVTRRATYTPRFDVSRGLVTLILRYQAGILAQGFRGQLSGKASFEAQMDHISNAQPNYHRIVLRHAMIQEGASRFDGSVPDLGCCRAERCLVWKNLALTHCFEFKRDS